MMLYTFYDAVFFAILYIFPCGCSVHTVFWAKKILNLGITEVFSFLLLQVSLDVEILASANIKVKSTQNFCRFLHYLYNISENYFRIEESIPLSRRTNLFLHSHQLSTIQVGQSSNCDTYDAVFFHAILSICSYGC